MDQPRDHIMQFFAYAHLPPALQTVSEVDRLKKELETEQARARRELELRQAASKRADDAELSARLTRGKLNALKKRTKNGVCPCCHRSFVQLQRHMATKHPDYAQEEPT